MSKVYVVRIRLPRDRSFIYFRVGPVPDGFVVDLHLIRRRYYSNKRVEVMRLPAAPRR